MQRKMASTIIAMTEAYVGEPMTKELLGVVDRDGSGQCTRNLGRGHRHLVTRRQQEVAGDWGGRTPEHRPTASDADECLVRGGPGHSRGQERSDRRAHGNGVVGFLAAREVVHQLDLDRAHNRTLSKDEAFAT